MLVTAKTMTTASRSPETPDPSVEEIGRHRALTVAA
jgi:hypothetical protein